MAMKSSEPVVQVIWPTVNVRPFGVAMEPEMMTVLFAWEEHMKDLLWGRGLESGDKMYYAQKTFAKDVLNWWLA